MKIRLYSYILHILEDRGASVRENRKNSKKRKSTGKDGPRITAWRGRLTQIQGVKCLKTLPASKRSIDGNLGIIIKHHDSMEPHFEVGR